jgi:hypothetical protein
VARPLSVLPAEVDIKALAIGEGHACAAVMGSMGSEIFCCGRRMGSRGARGSSLSRNLSNGTRSSSSFRSPYDDPFRARRATVAPPSRATAAERTIRNRLTSIEPKAGEASRLSHFGIRPKAGTRLAHAGAPSASRVSLYA